MQYLPPQKALLKQQTSTTHPCIFPTLKGRFLLLLGVFFAQLSYAAPIKPHLFNIIHKGEKVGQLLVIEKPTPSQTSYKYMMDMTTKFLFKKIHVEYNMDAVYKKGVLVNYHLVYRLNDKLIDEIDLKWVEDKYLIKTKKREKEHLKRIPYSTILLFCKKPTDRDKVWGELICEYSEISRVTDDHYKVILSNRKVNEYHYDSGKLIRASFQTPLIDFEMIRAK